MYSLASLAVLAAAVSATPMTLVERACPPIHIFAARGTVDSPNYGTTTPMVNRLLQAHSGATAEAINYPACGGQSSCGGISYGSSVASGTAAVTNQVKAFVAQCPNAKLVLLGHSQGGEIIDNALCGGGDPNQGLASDKTGLIASVSQIKAVILTGDPRNRAGAPYNVGTCKAQGFDARPAGQYCGNNNSKVQLYCDAADPYCCTGDSQAVHAGYYTEYNSQIFNFVQSKLA